MNRVRDRINQLRNRYNLEKRKVEIQKAEGYENARSSWPLFDNLKFLDGHIRPRKSYKFMNTIMKRPPGRPRRSRNYLMFDDGDGKAQTNHYTNPLSMHPPDFQIKAENPPSADESHANGQHYPEPFDM